MPFAFSEKILKKYVISYFYCKYCNFVQTEKPYWLDEAYNNPIADSDTGLIQRNISLSSRLAVLIALNFDLQGSYLDIAGGYGILTRLMRDDGFNYFWQDPYCQNVFALGFEGSKSEHGYDAITAFEVLEHVEDPVGFIQNAMLENNSKTIIFSTECFSAEAPPNSDWWYYSFSTGQHISFFSSRALQEISQKLHLYFYSFNGLHILSKYPLKYPTLSRVFTKRYLSSIFTFFLNRLLNSKTLSDSQLNLHKPASPE
ncbi:class I SAM-dependent methyltransferase [Polynucleobacter ibericus]|uniref:class I SAM-dependent methyltransferase n=1 Tax=Polynucleobacter ibericus TaxID=1819725 RepID=UPI001BFDF51A|nr:class I SAM-dependent methyltransferase [Polynucleobacter ibericus]